MPPFPSLFAPIHLREYVWRLRCRDSLWRNQRSEIPPILLLDSSKLRKGLDVMSEISEAASVGICVSAEVEQPEARGEGLDMGQQVSKAMGPQNPPPGPEQEMTLAMDDILEVAQCLKGMVEAIESARNNFLELKNVIEVPVVDKKPSEPEVGKGENFGPEEVGGLIRRAPGKCILCRSEVDDELQYGPKYGREGVVAHYYCILFASGLVQNGKDDSEGILGFRLEEIKEEARRASRLKCKYCGKTGAAVGCINKICRTGFHFPCGLKNRVQNQCLSGYESYCPNHYEPQEISVADDKWDCPVCLEKVVLSDNPVMAACCKGAIFHRNCLKELAQSAGYFFKCPMCNSKDEFVVECKRRGIFVPERDASWEKEPGAFQELYCKHAKCDAENCIDPEGREHNPTEGDFALAICGICGATGVHKQCGNVKNVDEWVCQPCFTVTGDVSNILKEDLAIINNGFFTAQARQQRAEENPDYVDVSRIQLTGRAKRSYPLTSEELEAYAKRGEEVLPDWRGKRPKMVLADWIGTNLTSMLSSSPSTSGSGNNLNPEKVSFKVLTYGSNNTTIIVGNKKKLIRPWNQGIHSLKPAKKMTGKGKGLRQITDFFKVR